MPADVHVLALDLGGVLIDWDPRHVYRDLIDDEAEMEHFLTEVCTFDWHRQHDLGRSMDDTIAELSTQHPEHAHLITAWRDRAGDMLNGAIDGTVALFGEVRRSGTPVIALSNMSVEGWDEAQRLFPFVREFDDWVISGLVGVAKPDPGIYEVLVERAGVAPESILFVDDVPANVEAAREAGIRAVRFESPDRLRADLEAHGLLPADLSR